MMEIIFFFLQIVRLYYYCIYRIHNCARFNGVILNAFNLNGGFFFTYFATKNFFFSVLIVGL